MQMIGLCTAALVEEDFNVVQALLCVSISSQQESVQQDNWLTEIKYTNPLIYIINPHNRLQTHSCIVTPFSPDPPCFSLHALLLIPLICLSASHSWVRFLLPLLINSVTLSVLLHLSNLNSSFHIQQPTFYHSCLVPAVSGLLQAPIIKVTFCFSFFSQHFLLLFPTCWLPGCKSFTSSSCARLII